MIPLSNRVYDSCSDSVFGQGEKETRQSRNFVTGGVERTRGTNWLVVSRGVCACLQGEVTGGDGSNEV